MNGNDPLDWNRYPAIINCIIRHAAPPTLRALRLTSPHLRYAVDKRLQSMYRVWGHRSEHALYRRRTYYLLASFASTELMIVEEFTGKPNPGRLPLVWRSPVIQFSELNFGTARPHVFFVWPHLTTYADFDPAGLYAHAPLADLVRLVAASSLVDGTMWLFVGPEEWDEKLAVGGTYESTFFEHFLDAVIRRRTGTGTEHPVTDQQRRLLQQTICATSRPSWAEWSRPEFVNYIEATQAFLLAPQPQAMYPPVMFPQVMFPQVVHPQ